jgi:predicted nucleic acid-binding protein
VSARTFVDTNVLVYADDAGAGEKRARSQERLLELTKDRKAVVSTQVLQEYFALATRTLKLPAAIARARVETFAQLDVVLLQPDLILSAIDLHRLHAISLWDALIVRAAVVGGCTRLLSEALQVGRTFEGLEVVNPFN